MSLVHPVRNTAEEETDENFDANASTFASFYDRHFDDLLAYFFKRTTDAHVAADLTAETFTDALKNLGKYRRDGTSTPTAWLYSIARTQLHRHFRFNDIHDRAITRLGNRDLRIDDSDLEFIETTIDLRQQAPLINRSLERLTPKLREAVVLRVLEEMTFEEIGAAMDCPTGTARQRVSRGLTQLHDFFLAGE